MVSMALILAYLVMGLTPGQDPPPQKSPARQETDAFFSLLDSKDVRKAYRTMVCDLWKQQSKEEAWVALITPWMLQRQSAPKERLFIEERPMPLPPGTTTGSVTLVRSKATYVAMTLYEDVTVYKPDGGALCVGGFWVSPAPF
jgi:hypothetical protein